ncbi:MULTISPECIES: YbhB/YbcL family Raf kinase inhibitor-like protein [unclassified Pseudodesulfovibrio]|uniref:YbhB/YbcL family Raf kinase inhibitor-like protein n=1 Tax=unclassified Pseudodesulfovibrio TaxID=2661612 RepID=UPI000FEBA712|nr:MULTISPECIES: YbhB/YbcL family Raf kinase inhibitor-like protein [unclassified Pseudodesulfovibrio]MCJ2164298.1 YbhB/YbcL family Raf kinase inhibitor-like protein [Pseudodesulfovibrio sp. S3-i]RWU04509.1 YbhB/YbcL family Raf kinase inhibitor-like protein [Pseudodesulfovibrio sp. S3]
MHRTRFSLSLALAFALALTFAPACMADGFTLTSPTVKDGGTLPPKHLLNGFGCTGENISPALQWQNPPAGTRSFAVTVYDPDAPTGSGWWHWVVFDIPKTATGLAEGGRLPEGTVQSRTDFGAPGYGGACPPEHHGEHRYIFTVHALNVEKLDLGADSSAAMVGFFLNAHSLGSATLTARYGR